MWSHGGMRGRGAPSSWVFSSQYFFSEPFGDSDAAIQLGLMRQSDSTAPKQCISAEKFSASAWGFSSASVNYLKNSFFRCTESLSPSNFDPETKPMCFHDARASFGTKHSWARRTTAFNATWRLKGQPFYPRSSCSTTIVDYQPLSWTILLSTISQYRTTSQSNNIISTMNYY